MTSGHQLPAKFIVHAVGPVWHGGGRDEARLLEQCYRHCFRLALEQNLKSIALPAISTGAFGFPKQQAAGIAARVMREFESQLEEIVACCFSEEDAEIYREALAEERE